MINCRYDIVKIVANFLNIKQVFESEDWNILWTDTYIALEKAKEMKRYQCMNYFPGMVEICRKDLLARNLNRMQKTFPRDYNFFPKTWCLPTELNDAITYAKLHRIRTFILKPDCGSQGKGIFLSKNLKDLKLTEKHICQVYISKPYLIDGYKFDIRIYSLVTSCDPLRIFVFNEGLVRFATSPYANPNDENSDNVYMHLTNYSLNKHNRTFIRNSTEHGSKRKISILNRFLMSKGVDIHKLWADVDDAIIKTIISAWPVLKHTYRTCFPLHDVIHACFQILGFDILIDSNLQPYILEVNHSPSFHTDTSLDREIKEELLSDTFNILNIWQLDKKKILEEDKKRVMERLFSKKPVFQNNYSSIDGKAISIFNRNHKDMYESQAQWEEENLGNFRLIFPCTKPYDKYFEQPLNTLFSNTTSSKVRGECAKQQRDDIQKIKSRSKVLEKLPCIGKHNKLCKNNTTNRVKSPNILQFQRLHPIGNRVSDSQNTKYFKATPINEAEERERMYRLEQRDNLVKSCKLFQQIYEGMKEMGTLHRRDQIKYEKDFNKDEKKRQILKNGDLTPLNIKDMKKINLSNLVSLPNFSKN